MTQLSTHSSKTSLRLPILLAFAAIYLIWGSTYLVIKFAIETIPPFLMAGTRFLLAGLLLYAVLRWSGVARPTWSQWRSAGFLGILMMCGGNGLVTWSEQMVPSALAALMVTTVPLWMVALDALFYGGPKPTGRVLFGLGLGLLGVVVLVGPSEGAVHPTGAVVLLIATFLWAQGSLRGRSAHLPKSPWMTAALQMIGGGLVLFVMATATGEWQRFDPAGISAVSLWSLAYLIFAGSIVALSAYVYLLRETTAASVSTYAFVNPVFALFLGWLAGETLNARSFVGAALVIGAVVLIHWAKTHKVEADETAQEEPTQRVPPDLSPPDLSPATCPSDR